MVSYIKVIGRMGDVISRGITIAYPAAVEDVLLKCPGVAKAAVVGAPDKRLGQEIAAFVVAKEGQVLSEEILRRYFKELYTTDEGLGITPGYFFIEQELPLNANGKVDKKLLKERAQQFVETKTAE